MRSKNKAVWGARFNNQTSKIFENIGSSIDVDKRLFEEDIFGSIVHANMLVKQKIISKEIGRKIINGLKKIKNFKIFRFVNIENKNLTHEKQK